MRVGFVGGKAEHGDDGFAEEQGIGSDRHDRPSVRVARLACAHLSVQAAPLCELPWQKNWGRPARNRVAQPSRRPSPRQAA